MSFRFIDIKQATDTLGYRKLSSILHERGLEQDAKRSHECRHCGKQIPRPYLPISETEAVLFPYPPCECMSLTDWRAKQPKRTPHGGRYVTPAKMTGYKEAREYAQDALISILTDAKSIYKYGVAGSGKSTRAHELRRLTEKMQGKSVFFENAVALYSRIIESKNPDKSYKYLAKIDYLFIDDVGMLPKTQGAVNFLYRVINDRYEENKPIVLTSQLSLADFDARFQSVDADGVRAIVSRLADMCEQIELAEHDWRVLNKGNGGTNVD